MPTSDDLRQRAAKLRAEADEHERQAAINRGDAARLEEIADRNDREAAEALERLGLPSDSNDGTMSAMLARADSGKMWTGIPGRAPEGRDEVSRAARKLGKSIREIARLIGMGDREKTLLSHVHRHKTKGTPIPPAVAKAVEALVAETVAAEKKRSR